MEKIKEQLESAAQKSGFYETGFLRTEDIMTYQEIRDICATDVCRNYGKSWACPPAVGTVAECEDRIKKYGTFMLFSAKYDIEDSFDFEGMKTALFDFKKLVDEFNSKINPVLSDYLLLSNEGCGRCEKCTYPEKECRFPELLYPSLEGYGLNVSKLSKAAGVKYINGSNTVTYFGALVF